MRPATRAWVSVLFSEPKIPQLRTAHQTSGLRRPSFSALQRAENSSTRTAAASAQHRSAFQCSSASRKFLNSDGRYVIHETRLKFQCSSASRKFLNTDSVGSARLYTVVSVLFSEPKIPQPFSYARSRRRGRAFQCSSASRKFLNLAATRRSAPLPQFQCSSASRKFLNRTWQTRNLHHPARFSALQRAENSSTRICEVAGHGVDGVSVLFSEPKIPQPRPSHLRPSIFPTAMITLRHS